MNIDWMSSWGNYIVSHRTPANWKEYGEEAGRLQAENEWDEFLFYRIASALALTPKAVAEKADELAHEMVDDFRLYGSEMWEKYANQHHGTPAERKIWISEFVRAYTKAMDAQVDALIPEKLAKNLDRFCELLSWMRMDMDHGDAKASDYGLRLSGNKKEEPKEPEKPKYVPNRRELHGLAVDRGERLIEKEWKRFMARESHGSEFRVGMLHFGVSFEEGWYVSDLDRDYFNEITAQTVQKELGKKALELAPASAWKNSYLICTLYDQMLLQDPPRKKPEGHQGFWMKAQREGYEREREQRTWRDAEKEKMRKELEKEAKREAQKGAKLSGPSEGRKALVIVHLSSLDSYTDYAGSEEGKLLGERLTQAILSHPGPVIIVDQDWETGYQASRPRESLLEAIQRRQDVVWIKFEEAEESWDDFFPKLYAALDQVEATSSVIGGIWYEPSLHTGCATFVYLHLKQRMPTVVDEDLVGCE
jgi:hypothetical protein